MAVINGLYTTYGLLTFGREFLPNDIQQQYQLNVLLPHLSWRTWLIIFLTVNLLIVLEGAYRAIRKREDAATALQQRDAASAIADWKDLSSRFANLPSHVRFVKADWQGNGDPQERWHISPGGGYGNKDCEALCRLAGAMLLRSPRVSALLPEGLRLLNNDVLRWLYFLKDNREEMKYSSVGVEMIDGSQKRIMFGTIDELPSVSARACLYCAAEET